MAPPKDRDLSSLRNPVALLPHYVAVCSATLVLLEIASGYDFDIADYAIGETVFTIMGTTNAKTISKEVEDTKGSRPWY